MCVAVRIKYIGPLLVVVVVCAAGVRMHPWTELETDMPADFF